MHDQPNIILCNCDQLRAFETSCYGNELIRTPNMQRLADEGCRVETAVSNAPVCMAARSVMLSGQYARSCMGFVGNVAHPNVQGDHRMPQYPVEGRPHLHDQTLPETLNAAGYHTRAVGKWHIHSWPHEIGFDDALIPRVYHCHSGQSFTHNGGREFIAPGYSVDYEADQVEGFIKSRKAGDAPFFLYYSISPPHCPLDDAPEKYTRMYDPADMVLRENVDPDHPLPDQDYHFKVWLHDYRYYHLHLPYTEVLPEGLGLRQLYALYYGMTTWVDVALGRMLNALDRQGLAENTVVVFTSDHGEMLGAHGLPNQKGSIHEESIRVPMLVRQPGSVPEASVMHNQVMGLVDLAPSLLSSAGLERPGHMQGVDRWDGLCGGSGGSDHPHAIIECPVPGSVGVRTLSQSYSIPLVDGKLASPPDCFFNTSEDPFQFENLAQTEHRTEPALEKCIRCWHEETSFLER